MATYQVNTGFVSHQRIGDEVIAIQFESGNYYSFVGSSADIWGAIGDGAGEDEIAALFALSASDPRREEISRFLQNLTDEHLITGSEEAASRVVPSRTIEWSVPAFSKFTDMSDLLLADPIHDVDETGWPNLRKEPVD